MVLVTITLTVQSCLCRVVALGTILVVALKDSEGGYQSKVGFARDMHTPTLHVLQPVTGVDPCPHEEEW